MPPTGPTPGVQVVAQLLGERPLPWESMSAEDRRKLGAFRKPILALLHRDAAERPSMSEFYDACNSIFSTSTTYAPAAHHLAPASTEHPTTTTTTTSVDNTATLNHAELLPRANAAATPSAAPPPTQPRTRPSWLTWDTQEGTVQTSYIPERHPLRPSGRGARA
jgi:hypothetical protein